MYMILGLDPSLAQQPEKLRAELTSNLALVATLRNKAESHAAAVKNTSFGIDVFPHPPLFSLFSRYIHVW